MSAIKKEKTTITQVAKFAGVSIGTVSNYLNGTAQVSPQKAENIQAAIDKLHYIGNLETGILQHGLHAEQVGMSRTP